VIAGPSGVGKGSVVQELLSGDPVGLALSVSVTTRPKRSTEAAGRDYVFVDAEAFDVLVAEGRLLEWAEVFGNRYGTPRAYVDAQLDAGSDVLLEIDVQGARQVREADAGAVLIFLAPPSMDELERRLRGRGTESEDRIRRRLETAAWEMTQRDRFDHVVENDDLERASSQVAAIIDASRTT
jgi:guanylate kinase